MHRDHRQENKLEKFIIEQFTKTTLYADFISRGNITDDPFIKSRLQIDKKVPTLAIVIGESGIGKTTSICKYVEGLRNSKDPVPVMFISVQKDPTKFNLKDFYESSFGTNDTVKIYETLRKLFGDREKTNKDPATIIIDNIQYCRDENGKIHSGLLTFFNNILYQGLGMSIILTSSVNNAAYEIDQGFLFL